MKKVGVLFLLLLLLTGCDGAPKEIERGMALRSSLLQGNGCSFDADITADYGDKVHSFSVSCQADAQGNLQFTITEPQTIAGITGIISEDSGKLTFDGMALEFDTMAEDRVSPVTAPWIFLKTLRSGYLTSACVEGEWLRLTIDDSYEDDALQLDIWLDEKNSPLRAEILCDGRRILSLDVGSFRVL